MVRKGSHQQQMCEVHHATERQSYETRNYMSVTQANIRAPVPGV